jgi:tol-pal system protein YbgF
MLRYPSLHALVLASLVLAGFAVTRPAFAQDATEILLRLDRLESENRRLTGQIDELKFANRRLEDQLKRFQTDADTRMRDLESGRGGAARPAGQTPAGQTQRRSDAFDPSQSPAAPGAPRQITPGAPLAGGALPNGALPQGGQPLDVTGQQRTAIPAVAQTPQPAGAGDAKSDFDAARALHDQGSFEQAENAFRDFTRKHARDRRVPEATFWLGETFFSRTRYREAAEHYLTVTTRYSNASRAPEAMLKLGMSLRGLGAKEEACGTFDQVPKKYPKAPAAVINAVNREKARAQC